jgi:hypothetical protein
MVVTVAVIEPDFMMILAVSDNKYYVKYTESFAPGGQDPAAKAASSKMTLSARLEAVPFHDCSMHASFNKLKSRWTRVSDPHGHFLYGHWAWLNNAPSIPIVWPLMKAASWLARKATVGAMSAAVPTLPSGVSFDQVPA